MTTDSSASDRAATPRLALVRFLVATVVGGAFFLVPVRVGGEWTIPFDVVVSGILEGVPRLVALYCLVVILLSAALSVLAEMQARGVVTAGRLDASYYRTGPAFLGCRVLGAVAAVLIYLGVGPQVILAESTGGLMFNTLVASVATIVPLGAVFITLLVSYGGVEFLGTLARPVMRPAFRVPGRGALDAIASYVGSYSVGIYVTNRLYLEGRYSAREATIIATCFSTVSMGFFAVVASTLGLLAYFPLIFASITVVMIVLAVVLCRVPPLSRKPDSYAAEPVGEREYTGGLFGHAVEEGLASAARARGAVTELRTGLVDGFKLSLLILPTILAIGLAAILLAEHTPVFTWLGRPLEPVLSLLGLPDVGTIAPASLIGVTEMFLPALLSTDAALAARFYVAVLSISQLLFFSAVIPLLLEVDVPVTLADCVVLFLLRTAIAIPLVAGITHLFF